MVSAKNFHSENNFTTVFNFLQRIFLLAFLLGIYSCTEENHFYETPVPIDEVIRDSETVAIVTNNPQEIVDFETVRATYRRGDTLLLRINRFGFEVEEHEITFEGTFTGDNERLIYCNTGDLVVGAGDSGSPILTTDGEIIGALCYGYSYANHQFAARAIEDVLGITSTELPNEVSNKNFQKFEPIGLSYSVKGMSLDDFSRYISLDTTDYFSRYTSISTTLNRPKSNVSSKERSTIDLIPGHSVSVVEVEGTRLGLYGTGTMSYKDESGIYGFGHEYGSGNYSALGASVYLSEMTTLIESEYIGFKLSMITDTYIGALSEDSHEGIHIKEEGIPENFTINSVVRINTTDYEDQHQVTYYNDTYAEKYFAAVICALLADIYLDEDGFFYEFINVNGYLHVQYENGGVNLPFSQVMYGFEVFDDLGSTFLSELLNLGYTGHLTEVDFVVNIGLVTEGL